MQRSQLRHPLNLLLLCLLLSACLPSQSASQVASPLVSPLDSPLPSPVSSPVAQAAPEMAGDLVPTLVQGNNAFAFDFYRAVAAESNENLIYSPYSISLAFSMAYAGAQGETAAQLMEVLHFLPPAEQAAAFAALGQQLASLTTAGAENSGGDDFRLNIANTLYGQTGYPFTEAYLTTLEQQYGAAPQLVDFVAEPERARQQINDWVAEQTNERITELVPPNLISPDTKLVLANAIYFYGSWLQPFIPTDTQPGPFTQLDGSQITAQLMHAPLRVPYMEGDGYQAVQLPYWGEQVDMLILLPTLERFTELEATLGPELLEEIRRQFAPHDTSLTLPRFAIDTSLDLKATLTTMGLSELSDFSGIGPDITLTDALHRGVITVDEEGTEAAAATALAMATSAYPSAEMVIDHPFIFAIMERETGTLLFLGRVLAPAK